MKGNALAPKGLLADSYRIAGISAEQCRSIFVDWALSMPADRTDGTSIRALLDQHGAQAPDHPMTQVLKEGLARPAKPGRRGGRRGRVAES